MGFSRAHWSSAGEARRDLDEVFIPQWSLVEVPACHFASLFSCGFVQVGLQWADVPCDRPESSLAGYYVGYPFCYYFSQHVGRCAGDLYHTVKHRIALLPPMGLQVLKKILKLQLEAFKCN